MLQRSHVNTDLPGSHTVVVKCKYPENEKINNVVLCVFFYYMYNVHISL